ncbi:hypothetical protein F5X97DRAFT_310042 [Nemania serpens]|nr:hypothetical protein F5X97DRAFT_310042 [Nemania serpens]
MFVGVLGVGSFMAISVASCTGVGSFTTGSSALWTGLSMVAIILRDCACCSTIISQGTPHINSPGGKSTRVDGSR